MVCTHSGIEVTQQSESFLAGKVPDDEVLNARGGGVHTDKGDRAFGAV